MLAGLVIVLGFALVDNTEMANLEAAPTWARVGYYALAVTLGAMCVLIDKIRETS